MQLLMKRRCSIILVLTVMLSSFIILLSPGPAEGIGEPVVTLEFDEGEEQQTAEIAPGTNAVVVFPGTVSAYLTAGSQVQDIVIELYGSVEQGWPVTMDPVSITMEEGGNESFTATVVVPADACCDMPAILEVGATVRPDPGAVMYNMAPINGTILITRYYGFSLESDDPLKDAYTGGDVEFHLTVNNDGNGMDTFFANILNEKELENIGMVVSPDRSSLDIGGKSSDELTVNIRLPDNNYCIGTHSIKIEVAPGNGDADPVAYAPQSYTFTLKVSKAPVPETPDPVPPDPTDPPDGSDVPDEPDTPDGSGNQNNDDTDGTPSGGSSDVASGDSSDGWGLLPVLIGVIVVIIIIVVFFVRRR